MLTERKKADRAQMATAVAMLAGSLGATVEIEKEGENSLCTRQIRIRIYAPRGLCLNVEFDGESSMPDRHVLSWHMASDVDTCFADAFGAVGDLNRCHWRKASSFPADFADLLRILESGLTLAASGAAFDDKREAEAVAKRGQTAAQRDAVTERAFQANRAAGESAAFGPAFSMDCESAIAFIEKWAPGGIPLAVSADGRSVVAADAACAARDRLAA